MQPLIEAYQAGTDLLRTSVAGLTADQLRWRPESGRWSTLEVVCHICDTEQMFADWMKRTLAMDRPLPVGADGNLFPNAVGYHDRDLDEELALVSMTRGQMARILRLAPDDAWDRHVVHTELGPVTLKQLLEHAVRHLEEHVASIDNKRHNIDRELPGDLHEVARQGDLVISTDRRLLDVAMLHNFLANRSYWATGRPLDVVRRSLENSLCFGLYENHRQIGFARVVTDQATFAWLCDVFVLEPYRGRGLAKWLIGHVMGCPTLQGLRRVLLGTRDAHGLYERYGFTPLADAARFMEVFRPDLYGKEHKNG
jgi:GNAT superfamily N-acetyltransferase